MTQTFYINYSYFNQNDNNKKSSKSFVKTTVIEDDIDETFEQIIKFESFFGETNFY